VNLRFERLAVNLPTSRSLGPLTFQTEPREVRVFCCRSAVWPRSTLRLKTAAALPSSSPPPSPTGRQVQALVDETAETFGGVDVLINNAGIMPLSLMARQRGRGDMAVSSPNHEASVTRDVLALSPHLLRAWKVAQKREEATLPAKSFGYKGVSHSVPCGARNGDPVPGDPGGKNQFRVGSTGKRWRPEPCERLPRGRRDPEKNIQGNPKRRVPKRRRCARQKAGGADRDHRS